MNEYNRPENMTPAENGNQNIATLSSNVPQTDGSLEGSGPSPQKKTGPKKALPLGIAIGAGVVLVIGICLFLFARRPETSIYTAMAKTMTLLEERNAALDAAIPAREATRRQQRSGASHSTFSFNVADFAHSDTAATMLLEYILTGIDLTGTYTVNPAAQIARFDTALGWKSEDILSAELEISPAQISLALPSLTESVYAISPASFAEDYRSSLFMESSSMTDDTLNYAQELLVSQINNFFASQQVDTNRVLADCQDILLQMVSDAEFSRDGQSEGQTVYKIQLQGDKVRQAVLDLAAYWYVDSPWGQRANAVEGYQEEVESQILMPLASALTEMPTVVEVHVDDQNIVRWANAEVTFSPDPVTGISPPYTKCTLAFGLDEQEQMSFHLHLEEEDDFLGPIHNALEVQEVIAENQELYMIEGNYLLDSAIAHIEADFSLYASSQGDYDMTIDMVGGEDETRTEINMTMDSQYSLTEQGFRWEWDKLSMGILSPDAYMSFNTQGHVDMEPVSATDVALRTDVTPILSMTQDEFTAEVERLYGAFQEMAAQFLA